VTNSASLTAIIIIDPVCTCQPVSRGE